MGPHDSGRLWAPWRYLYISGGDQQEGCLFERLASAEDDRESLVLLRGRAAFAMLNAYPYTSGHLMVAPYRHVGSLEELSDAELLEINQLVAQCTGWLRAAYSPDGFNIGVNVGSAAGAGVPDHVHWHVVPRWTGDTNFMTSVGEVRVLPHDLLESYDLLLNVVRNSK